MSAETLERSVLEGKDREQLIAIATALGLKALSRAKKGEIIDRILEHTGASAAGNALGASNGNGAARTRPGREPAAASPEAAERPASDAEAAGSPDRDEPDEPLADWEIALREAGDDKPGSA